MLRYRRGLAYSDAGETDKAIDDFTYVIETGLKTKGIINDFVEDRSIPYGDLVGTGYAGRALALIKSDRLDEALTDADRAVKINANHAGIRVPRQMRPTSSRLKATPA
ncbi:MAG: tetratricopeptide repeat protein [Hyphomicrobium sp.]|jgi:tetratricopeptide (TPR) repeat protein